MSKQKRIMYVGGGWGNAIYRFDDDETRIYGFKDRYRNGFAEGSLLFDLAHHVNDDRVPLYIITNIDYKDDPRDMFFADITLVGEVKNPKPGNGNYENEWYVEPCRELLNEYKKVYEAIPFLSFKERKKTKRLIGTLEELLEDK